MKKTIITILGLTLSTSLMGQTDVTKKYIENPDFGARFAGWVNTGKFTFSVGSNFSQKSGEVFLELWKSSGSKLGTNAGIKQTLRHLPAGTYTLVAGAQNLQQGAAGNQQTGAYLYAGKSQVEISDSAQYSVVFTAVENASLDIGVKLQSCTGNWVAVDNFRLYYNGVNADSLAQEQARVDEEVATLRSNIENATGATPKVTTNPYVAMGSTILLGRSTVNTNGATIKERGFCWSTSPNPTIFDDKTTTCFTETGNLYRMEGLEPGTIYYVRAYALSGGYQLAYGDVVKVATLPKGSVTCQYDYKGDAETNYRINSAMQECVWMYNNLCNIKGINLNVHYVPGAGAGGGTADCSYGGWMRVSQNTPYQQTGTLLHETNHGVGIGTTGEWYNNANLRSNTSSGKWLGPRATKMVQFLENNDAAFMQGDGTHMWAGTTSGTLKYGYGINGAHEDSYQPSNQLLYWGNALITHAMHQDGIIATSSMGFAAPSYTFTQDDSTKYYIKVADETCGTLTRYLCTTATGILKYKDASAEEVVGDDTYAWYVTYNPRTALYHIQNVGSGKYFTYSSTGIKTVTKTNGPTSSEEFMLMPARQKTAYGDYKGSAYWVIKNNQSGHPSMQCSAAGSISATKFNASNSATNQQWFFLTSEEIEKVEKTAVSAMASELTALISNVRKVAEVPHVVRTEETSLETIDSDLEDILFIAESAEDYSSISRIQTHIDNVVTGLQDFLTNVSPASAAEPFDLTFLLVNPDFATSSAGWSISADWMNSCCEFYQTTFDFNQTTKIKLPKATYGVRVQAFQRPGTLDDLYYDYIQNGVNNVNAILYAKTKNVKLRNIYEEASKSRPHSECLAIDNLYIPNTMSSAAAYFKKGLYDNSLLITTSTLATIKLGIKGTAGTGYWTCFDNFRLFCYGGIDAETVTPVEAIQPANQSLHANVIYDLTGRRVINPTKGIYVVNGKKVFIK